MNHRDNLINALEHRDGPVPIDFGATAVTGIHASCVAALREHYGLEPRPVKVHEPYQMLGLIEEDLLDAMDIACAGLHPPRTMFGFENAEWKEWRTPWGQEVLVGRDFTVTPAPQGGLHIYPEGDTEAPPSGHMPAAGYFFDSIVRQEPLDEDNMNVEDNLEEFGPVSQTDLAYFKEQAERLAESGRGVVATFGGLALGDIALVPAPFLKRPKGIRDISQWYMATAMRPDFVRAIFERQTEIAIENLERLHQTVGERIDVLFICGTDFGTQNSSFCAPSTFDEIYAPYYKRINDWVHAHTGWKTFKHSCGAVEPFMSHFIEAGFDIINPVQCSATGMDPVTLKERYGERLVFWGGGVDTQKTLPRGTSDEVRAEVQERLGILAPGGGFVFNAIHNVQALTPTENIVAMIETVRDYNRG